MAVEAVEFYNNLNQLLADICKFLHDESNYKKLSGESRRQADALISRSKQQLQEISKIQVNDADEAYVDMDRRLSIEAEADADDDEHNNIYADVEPATVNNNTINKIFAKGPYDDLPAKQMSRDVKFGNLTLKSKTIFGFEKKRRLFGGIHFERLILYLSEKDSKPFQVLNLDFCKAEAIEKCTKPSMDFILKTNDAQKTYYFTALSHKDMLQWVVFVNEHDRRKLLDKNKDFEENYDSVNEVELQNQPEIIPTNAKIIADDDNDDDEAIYNSIAEPLNNEHIPIPCSNHPPKLPDRPPGPRRALPQIPTPRPISEQSLASYAPIDESNIEDSLDEDSFSDDGDESDYYEEFVSRPAEISEILVTKTEPPLPPPAKESISVKPPTPALKPKPPVPLAKPSMLYRSRFGSLKKTEQ